MENSLKMDRIRDRQNRSWDGMFYSNQRLDLLIVSISGAGIYVCLETIKYLSDKFQDINLLISISGGLFLFGIITNFISQIANYQSNYDGYLMCDYKLDNDENKSDFNEDKIKHHKSKSEKYSKRTGIFNYISAGFMLFGLFFMMFYFLFIF
jgi:hypothetical protein